MKEPVITRIDIYKLDIPLRVPFRFALGLLEHTENVLVQIHSSDGTYGLGEASPIWFITGETQAIDFEAAKTLGRLIVGRNPLAIEERMAELNRFLAHNSTIKSAFDIALYDLAAKRAGLPLYALLGGERRDFDTDLTIGIGAPESMAGEALEIKRQGFRAIKV